MSTPPPTSSPATPGTNNTSPPPSLTSPPPTPIFQLPPPVVAQPPLPPVVSPPPPPPPVSTSPPPNSSPPPPGAAVPPPVVSPPAPPGAATPPSADSPPAPPPPVARPSPPGSNAPPTTPSPPGSNAPPTTPSPPGSNAPPRTPSPPAQTPPSPSSSSSTGIVVGAVVTGVVVLAVVAVVLFCCFRKKKKKKRHDLPEYRPPPPPYKVDPYGGGQNQWAYYAPPPADIAGKVPPRLSPPPAYIARPPGGPSPHPSLPPPPNSYSVGSGSNGSSTDVPSPRPFFGLSKNNTFSYEELSRATEGFSDANLLGQGAFGYVYKGMLADGREVAIKQRKVGSWQGEKEFDAEVEIISRVHHRHLVSLVGYCSAGDQKLLVYEFVPNNNLEFHLHGKGRPTLEWSDRQKIALGAAKGLAYLHEDCHPKIIHRDIKAANILLDSNFEAKVADFGLAKDAPDPNNTQFPTRIVGTPGYLAPEYASSGNVSYKSDVYSFGVMLLELITGKRPINSTPAHADDGLVNWAMPLLKLALEEDDYEELVDRKLQNNYDRAEMARMVACAAGSVRHLSRQRPLMSQIVRTLEGGGISLDTLKENGIPPGRRMDGSSDYDSSSQQYNTTQRNKDIMRHRQLAFESEVYTSNSSSSEGQITREMVGRARQG